MFIEVTGEDNLKRLINLDYVEDIADADEKEKKDGTGCVICYSAQDEILLGVKETFEAVRTMVRSAGMSTATVAYPSPTNLEVKRYTVAPADVGTPQMPTLLNKLVVKKASVPVDSGSLLLGDVRVLKELGLRIGDGVESLDSVNEITSSAIDEHGFTLLTVMVDCWLGEVGDVFRIPLPSGKVFLGDPCHYVDNDHWDEFRKKPLPPGVFEILTGGDGSFDFTILAEKP